jgi:hypothetical protein
MDGFQFFKRYQALRLHFFTDYDIFKYHGKISLKTRTKFDKRQDADVFNNWGNLIQSDHEAGQLCIANNIYNSEFWVYDADKEQAQHTYLKWVGIRESISKVFEDDCNTLMRYVNDGKLSKFSDSLCKTPSGRIPPLLQLYLSNRVSAEFLIILDTISAPFLNKWLKEYENDPLIKVKVYILVKYKTFCAYDPKRIIPIYKEVIEEHETGN